MPTLAQLWLPILLSAVFVFVVSSVLHMVIQMHKGDYKRLPDEDGLLDALRRLGVGAGQYVFPHCGSMQDFKKPEVKAKFERGPIGTMVVRGADGVNMGKALGQWFAFCIVIAIFVAYLTSLGAAHGVFRVATTVALLGHGFTSVCDSIWKGVSWSTTAKFVLDGVIYAFVTGATFAWLWPAAA